MAVGTVKTVSIEGEESVQLFHGGENIDLKRLSDRFFKPTLNSEGIIESFPDRHAIETVTSAGENASKKERDQAFIV